MLKLKLQPSANPTETLADMPGDLKSCTHVLLRTDGSRWPLGLACLKPFFREESVARTETESETVIGAIIFVIVNK